MDPTHILDIQDLRISFPLPGRTVEAVRGISFQLKKGETLGIVGESGSGKSVTALAILGLLSTPGHLAGGKIRFRSSTGEILDLSGPVNPPYHRVRGREIGMIFQEPMSSLNPVFRCGQQVLESVLLHTTSGRKEARQKVLSLFSMVRLDDPERIFRSFPHQLSGGQRQRVMIAMALAGNPSLLIADEPTSALDVTVQKSMLELFNHLKNDWGGSAIFISHDLGVIREVADASLSCTGGEIVEMGEVQHIFNQPSHEYTRKLLADYQQLRIPPVERPKSSQPDPVLTIRHLKTWFPEKKNLLGRPTSFTKAVDDVTLEIFEGETLGLVGESGSGKTTLGRTLLFLHPPTGGEVVYDGKQLSQLPDQAWKSFRKDMQIIFQDPFASLDPRQRVGQAILEPMQVHGIGSHPAERKQKVLDLLQDVGLEPGHFDRFPHEFSGGQRQRICMARALALEPRFIVCDECVSALDVTIQTQIIRLLKAMQQKHGLTYLFISHDLSVVRQISDRIAVMKDGRIVELAPAGELYAQPKNEYTRQLLMASPGL